MPDLTISIDGKRLWGRLMRLAEIGRTVQGGVNRQALSDEEAEAWRLVIGWGQEAGLVASTDAAANLFLTLPGHDPGLLPVMMGSHLDSQPAGGKFDGAFGVLAALEVAASFAKANVRLGRDIVVVAWMNEEGSRFAPGMMGSAAFVGQRPIEEIRAVTDAGGFTAGGEIDRLLAHFPDLPRRRPGFPVAAYLEPHIEQDIHLEASGRTIGIVTGIQGKQTFEVEIRGEKGHAGTQAMARRKDAVMAFARIATALQNEIGDRDDMVKLTIGRVDVSPNAPSVVAGNVRFRIDLRHPANAVLDHCGRRIAAICHEQAHPCSAAVIPLVSAASNEFDRELQDMIAACAASRGISAAALLSCAGHDARHLAECCPSAMIFIPCRGGISHDEAEWAEPSHVTAGAQILADVVLRLTGASAG